MANKGVKLVVKTASRNYTFTVNGYQFSFMIPWKDESTMHPQDVLSQDLMQILEQLRNAEKFPIASDAFKVGNV